MTLTNLQPVLARRCESDYPAEWVCSDDASFETFEHVAHEHCHCASCLEEKRERVAQLSGSYLLKYAELEAANEQRSRAETLRCPRMSVIEASAMEVE